MIRLQFLRPTTSIIGKMFHQSTVKRFQYVLQNSSRQIHKSFQINKLVPGTGGVDPPIPMTEEEVGQRVLKAIKDWDRFPQDRANILTLDAKFVEDLSFDSLDLVEIVLSLEDEFQFEITQEDAEKFRTPRDIANFVIEHEGVGEDEF